MCVYVIGVKVFSVSLCLLSQWNQSGGYSAPPPPAGSGGQPDYNAGYGGGQGDYQHNHYGPVSLSLSLSHA